MIALFQSRTCTRPGVAAALCLISFTLCWGQTTNAPTRTADHTAALFNVPPAELPDRIVQMVLATPESERRNTTAQLVRTSARLRPGAILPVIAAVARAAPELAATAAETAALEHRKLATYIAQVAVANATNKCRQIVAGVCRAAPEQVKAVACAVAELEPNLAHEILAGVSDAFPDLAPYIAEVLTEYQGTVPSVRLILDRAIARMLKDKDKLPPDSIFNKPLPEWPFEPGLDPRRKNIGGVDYSRP